MPVLTRLRRDEHGLTVVEGMIAALILVLGALGVMQVFDTSTRNNFRAEQSQAVNNRLQAELERIRQLPYDQIALTAYPQPATGENDPRSRMVADTVFAVDRGGDPGSAEELVVNGAPVPGEGSEQVQGGAVDPGPDPFSAGDISGEIYRFITWTADPECPECGEGAMKRIVVAAKLTEAPVSFERAYQEVQTDVVDPDLVPDENPAPPGDPEDGNVVELWLTDTSCDHQTRQVPAVPHDAHNTRGRCADEEQTGDATPGAPDLLFTEAPPEVDPANDPPLADYDFAADVSGSDDAIGLTMPWSATDSCLLEPVLSLVDIRRTLEGILAPVVGTPGPLDGVLDLVGGDPNKHLRVHKWVSPPVGGNGGVLLGEGTLDLWTRTVNGAIHPGEICATVFIRQTIQVPTLPDEICLPVVGCVSTEVNLGLIDFDVSPPKLCILSICVPVPLQDVSVEVDVPLVNIGLLTNQNGLVCDQGLNLTYFRCSMSQWPTEWSKVSIPLDFAAVNTAGQLIPAVLPPQSQIGLALMVKRSGTEPGQGLEFMYDHPDFESRLQLKTESLLCFGNC